MARSSEINALRSTVRRLHPLIVDAIAYTCVFSNRKIAQKMKNYLLNEDTIQRFTTEEISLIEKSFPIIWGSYNAQSYPLAEGDPCDRVVRKAMVLQKDIQVAFTTLPYIKELQKILNPYEVQVFSMDDAYFLQQKQRCMRNE